MSKYWKVKVDYVLKKYNNITLIEKDTHMDRYLQRFCVMKVLNRIFFVLSAVLLPLPAFAVDAINLEIWERERDDSISNPKLTDPLSYRDCSQEYEWTFRYTYSGLGSGYMYWYLGTDCSDQENRNNPNMCINLPEANPEKPRIQGGTWKWKSNELYMAATGLQMEECAPYEGEMNIWLIVMDSLSDEDVYCSDHIQIRIDTQGPQPATGVTSIFAEEGANVEWEEGSNNATDIRGFYILCWPVPSNVPSAETEETTEEEEEEDDDESTSSDAGTKSASYFFASDRAMDGGMDAAMDAGPDSDSGVDASEQTDGGSADTDVDADTDTDMDTNDDNVGLCGKAGGFGPGDAVNIEDYRCTGILGSSTRSHTVRGLENDVEYRFGVVTLDEALNPSVVSNVSCSTPQDVRSFLDDYIDSGGEGNGFCFIATAAYGSYDHPHVRILRKFRDSFLATLPCGPGLIRAYYRVGPALAEITTQNETLRSAVRIALVPVTGLAFILVTIGPALSLALLSIMIGGTVALACFRKRRRRILS